MTNSNERDEFWRGIEIPINPNYEQDGTPPANPVTVSDRFLTAGAQATHLGAQAEEMIERAERLEWVIADLKRAIYKRNFKSIVASWKPEQIEAFIEDHATPEEWERYFTAVTELRETRLVVERMQRRMKALERIMDWAKQYVDFDKFQGKIRASGRG